MTMTTTNSYRDKLLAKGARQYKRVEVEGEEYWLRRPSGYEQTQFELRQLDPKTSQWAGERFLDAKYWLLACCLCEGDGGERCFAEGEWKALAELDPSVTEPLFSEVIAMIPRAKEEVKEALGNSD